MLQLIEHTPIILFFATCFTYDFFTATQLFVFATFIALLIKILHNPKQPIKNYLNQALVVSLGGISLLTNNPIYLVWGPSIKYLVLSIALLSSQLLFKKSLIEKGFQLADIHAPHYAWKRLDYILSASFFIMSVINIQVFKSYGSITWSKFKAMSLFGWALLFIPIVLHIESKRHETQPN